MFGLQFHPEVAHTPRGTRDHCQFRPRHLRLRQELDDAQLHRPGGGGDSQRRSAQERVILGLSGGVDSSVAAALLHKAIGDQLTCIFVNNGVLRGREAEVVREVFGRHFKTQTAIRERLEAVPAPAQGRDRPGAQTEDHRQDLHRGVREPPPGARARRSSSPRARFIRT